MFQPKVDILKIATRLDEEIMGTPDGIVGRLDIDTESVVVIDVRKSENRISASVCGAVGETGAVADYESTSVFNVAGDDNSEGNCVGEVYCLGVGVSETEPASSVNVSSAGCFENEFVFAADFGAVEVGRVVTADKQDFENKSSSTVQVEGVNDLEIDVGAGKLIEIKES